MFEERMGSTHIRTASEDLATGIDEHFPERFFEQITDKVWHLIGSAQEALFAQSFIRLAEMFLDFFSLSWCRVSQEFCRVNPISVFTSAKVAETYPLRTTRSAPPDIG